MNGLPTGMFIHGNSIIHKLDPRIKLLAFIISTIAIICADSILGFAVLSAAVIIIVLLSQISFKIIIYPIKRLIFFFAIILLMNICFFSPDNPWVALWIFTPSYEGLTQGLTVVFRVCLILIINNTMTATTAPMELTEALKAFISPLRFIGMPSNQIALIISVAIQFIPTLFEETDMIRKAQLARGARFDSKKLTEKAKAIIPLAVPIFIAAFRRADELSLAMEARGYDTSSKRMKKKNAPFTIKDISTLIFVTVVCTAEILLF